MPLPAEGPQPSRGPGATSSLRCPLRLRAAAALRGGRPGLPVWARGGRIALPAEAATAAAAAPAVRWWGFLSPAAEVAGLGFLSEDAQGSGRLRV